MAEPLIRVGDALINPAYVVMMNVTAGSWESPETVVLTLVTGTQATYSGEILKTALDQLKMLSGGMLGKYVAPSSSDDIGFRRASK